MSTRLPLPRVAFASLPLLLLGACADQLPTGPAAGPTLSRGGKAAPDAPAGTSVVMSGLNSPKGLAFGPEGALYVAETGTGAERGPCIPAGEGPACVSNTGSVSRLWKGEQERVASGLPSLAGGGGAAAGPQDVSFQGRGNMYVTIGLGSDPRLRSALGEAGASYATLIRVTPNGQWRPAADLGAVEIARNPDQGAIDSNPFGVLAEPGRQYVADAGANALVAVRANGEAEPVATFASIPLPPGLPFPIPAAQPVPTEVVRGSDGALYVSTLAGFPFVPGTAAIYRVTPGGTPAVFQGGFTSVTDFDFAPDGTLYVLQFATGPFLSGPGAVIRVAPDGTRTTLTTALTQPTGLVVGPDGALYVSNKGTAVGGGEVLRIGL